MAKKENPNQLKLFMTARELVENHEPLDGDFLPDETNAELWDRKASESEENGLMDSIREKGVQIPISIHPTSGVIVGGHHRIASQYKLNPDQFIAINYQTSPATANMYDSLTTQNSEVKLPNFDKAPYDYDDSY